MWYLRPSIAFHVPSRAATRCRRLFASCSISYENGVSRLSALQTLLSQHGAPGSRDCTKANDLEPVISVQDTPELVSSLSGTVENDEHADLFPYLFPIAKSKATGSYICSYRNPFVEDTDSKNNMWPIVETKVGAPGLNHLALNSEHLMRRIACECDFNGGDPETLAVYNEGLGKGLLQEGLDVPYEAGSVEKLGYGVDKYVLLRVGPFADLYEKMALEHKARGDVQSSLIAAEASNGKIVGFGQTFRFFAKLLSTFPDREDESRDAARMCLRMPLPTMGMTFEDFKEVAVLGQIAEKSDSMDTALSKIQEMYGKMKEIEKEDDPHNGKTPEQVVIDEANELIDVTALSGAKWRSIRAELGKQFRSVAREDMANYVDLTSK